MDRSMCPSMGRELSSWEKRDSMTWAKVSCLGLGKMLGQGGGQPYRLGPWVVGQVEHSGLLLGNSSVSECLGRAAYRASGHPRPGWKADSLGRKMPFHWLTLQLGKIGEATSPWHHSWWVAG